MRQKLEPQVFTESADFHGLSVLIPHIRVNLRFLLVAEPMINAVLLIIPEAFVSMPVANYDLYSTA
jgi:hypothetical protein